jgi:hypothetical protein
LPKGEEMKIDLTQLKEAEAKYHEVKETYLDAQAKVFVMLLPFMKAWIGNGNFEITDVWVYYDNVRVSYIWVSMGCESDEELFIPFEAFDSDDMLSWMKDYHKRLEEEELRQYNDKSLQRKREEFERLKKELGEE